MKATFLVTLAASTASVQAQVRSTINECFKNEGGKLIGSCSDVYFLTCDIYEVNPDSSCNVFTFSDSRLIWDSNDITVKYLDYYLKFDADPNTEITAEQFEEGGVCVPANEDSSFNPYDKGKVMNYTGGMCGFKY